MITQETILSLLEQSRDPSISIYLPTHIKGEEVQQDPIRFKNLLKRAEKQLKAREVEDAKIKKLLKEPRKLLDQPLFWQHNDRGLAVFITDKSFEYYRVPLDFKEQVMVEDHFLITPLLPMTTLEGTYCILALSQKNTRLLRCTRESVRPIEFEEAPTSLEEFLKYDVVEKHLQHHSGRGKGRSIFHGQGGAGDVKTEIILNYLKTIENEVTAILRKRNDPLILAGVEKAVAEYRIANHYSRLMDEAIISNPDPLSDSEIRNRGWEIIKSHFLKEMYDDIQRFADLTGTDKQSDNLSKVVEASYYGKVDSLFVPVGEQSWGWFDPDRDTVHHSSEQQNGEHDLINMAAIKTLMQGGDVYALNKEDMPQKKSIAAIFRYA
ncbi:MAG TPA: hypothetical protein VE868_02210 [Balneolaceae bacterium]|nr:hypothetical protein [Balneolaceae bacterium]